MGHVSVWAVHLSDGVLGPTWQVAGFVLAGLLMILGAWRIREEDIPSTAVLAAAFFVSTYLHVPVGPSKVHLLFSGLIGVVLGRRAALAIPVGLLLQALLLGHGGFLTLGVNSCVMILPALVSAGLFHLLHRRQPSLALVAASAVPAGLGVVAAVTLIVTNLSGSAQPLDPGPTIEVLLHPATIIGVGLLAVGVLLIGRGRTIAPEFALGLFLGQLSVLLTVALQAVVLILGGQESYAVPVAVLFLLHLPVAVVEGLVLGSTVGFLVRVKPQMLGLSPPPPVSEEVACSPASAP